MRKRKRSLLNTIGKGFRLLFYGTLIYIVLLGSTISYNPDKAKKGVFDAIKGFIGKTVEVVKIVKPIFV